MVLANITVQGFQSLFGIVAFVLDEVAVGVSHLGNSKRAGKIIFYIQRPFSSAISFLEFSYARGLAETWMASAN
jgi:hypothetical protein